MSTIQKTICLETEVTDRIEKMRKSRARFVSGYINSVLKKGAWFGGKGEKMSATESCMTTADQIEYDRFTELNRLKSQRISNDVW